MMTRHSSLEDLPRLFENPGGPTTEYEVFLNHLPRLTPCQGLRRAADRMRTWLGSRPAGQGGVFRYAPAGLGVTGDVSKGLFGRYFERYELEQRPTNNGTKVWCN